MKMKKISTIAIVFLCIISSCKEDPISSNTSPTSLFIVNGRIENWIYGDTVNIHCVSIHVDYALQRYDSDEIFSSSAINHNGDYSLAIRNPKIWDSLYGYSQKILFQENRNIISYFSSDTNARFELSMFQFYSSHWVNMQLRLRNSSFNFSSLRDSLVKTGDYYCNTKYYWTDRNVTIRYNEMAISSDTIMYNADLEFSKGWNKLVSTVKSKRNKYIQIEQRVDNSFGGKYYIFPE